jgi:hypothetical protein
MKKLILPFLFVIPLLVYAQKSPVKYGDISIEEMTMKMYDRDSSAAAVVLLDYGLAYVSVNTGTVVLNVERHTRIKVLKKEGLEWANGSVLTYHEGATEERVIGLKASAYNLEGGKIVETKMSKDGTFKDKYNRSYNQQKFTIPNVKEGTVIEYTYKIYSEFFWNFPNWTFQRKIPTRRSEYWAMFPSIFKYQQYMQGYVPVTSYNVNDQMYFGENVAAHHWISNNVPAFKDEPFMTSEDDYLSKINFALAIIEYSSGTKDIMGTWRKLNDDLLDSESFGRVISGSGFLKEQVDALITGVADPLQKISLISTYIKQNIEWNEVEDFRADPLKKIIERKKGSTGDVNLLFASMLQKAGLDVDMVLLSTRDHGFIRQAYPMQRQFNYVVCLVRMDGKSILLDATEKYLPFDVLPSKCLNGQGLVISATNHGWIDITTRGKAKTIVSTDVVLDASGELKGKVIYIRDGYDAQSMRETYYKKGEETYVKDFQAGKQWTIAKTEFQDLKEVGKQSRETHEMSVAEHTSVAGDIIYVNPFITSQMEQNPFKSEKREYPVDFGNPFEKTYMCKITLPEGYQVDEIPQNKLLALPGNAGRYVYNISQMGNMISLTSTFQINKSLFTQDEYKLLKEFYSQVIAKQSEQVVVKKKP